MYKAESYFDGSTVDAPLELHGARWQPSSKIAAAAICATQWFSCELKKRADCTSATRWHYEHRCEITCNFVDSVHSVTQNTQYGRYSGKLDCHSVIRCLVGLATAMTTATKKQNVLSL